MRSAPSGREIKKEEGKVIRLQAFVLGTGALRARDVGDAKITIDFGTNDGGNTLASLAPRHALNQWAGSLVAGLFATFISTAVGQIIPNSYPSSLPATLSTGDLSNVQTAISVGDPAGVPPTTLADHVDPNVIASPFRGVVSLSFKFSPADNLGGFCSGTPVSRHHIVTAAHCVDVTGGTDPFGDATGDGTIDVAPADSSVFFNHTGPIAAVLGVSSITVHPDWHGFANTLGPEGASINDDISVLTLSSPIPAGVPFYPMDTTPFEFVTPSILVGYGGGGDAVAGYTTGPAFDVKRTGWNHHSVFSLDDEAPGTAKERFAFDMDGPDLVTSTIDSLPTIGNDLEVTFGPGDSGSPSFIWTDNGNTTVDDGELTLFGVNTFTRGVAGTSLPITPAPLFGSQGGGMLVSTYEPWVNTIVPEPRSMFLVAFGLVVIDRFFRRRRTLVCTTS